MYSNMYAMRFLPTLAFMMHLYNVHCSDSTITKTGHGLKQTISNNLMSQKARIEMHDKIFGQHQIQIPAEINTMETSAAQFLLELYNRIKTDDKYETALLEPNQRHLSLNNSHFPHIHELNGADFIMGFVNDAHKQDFTRQDRDLVVYFDISYVSPGHILSKAELNLHKRETTRRKKSKYRIQIFRLRRGNDTEEKIIEPEANLTLSGDYEGWLRINVTAAANYWIVNRNKNFGLYVQVMDVETGQEIDPNKSGIGVYDGPKDKQPFLIVFVRNHDEEPLRRTRSGRRHENDASIEQETAREYYKRDLGKFRSSGKSSSNPGGSQMCQRHNLYINFTALGWNHIIAPPGYDAFYCAGECEYSPSASVTTHSMIQSLLNLDVPDSIPKPCCSPSKLSKNQVLYTADNKIVVLKHYDDMVVEDCACF